MPPPMRRDVLGSASTGDLGLDALGHRSAGVRQGMSAVPLHALFEQTVGRYPMRSMAGVVEIRVAHEIIDVTD